MYSLTISEKTAPSVKHITVARTSSFPGNADSRWSGMHPFANLVPRALSLAWRRGGKRPWQRLVACLHKYSWKHMYEFLWLINSAFWLVDTGQNFLRTKYFGESSRINLQLRTRHCGWEEQQIQWFTDVYGAINSQKSSSAKFSLPALRRCIREPPLASCFR